MEIREHYVIGFDCEERELLKELHCYPELVSIQFESPSKMYEAIRGVLVYEESIGNYVVHLEINVENGLTTKIIRSGNKTLSWRERLT